MIVEKEGKWVFQSHALYADRVISIDWNTFQFGKIQSKYERAVLRSSTKDFLRALVLHLDSIGGRPSPGSIANYARRLRILVRWMIENQIIRFAALEKNDLVTFLSARSAKDGVGKLTDRTVRGYILLFEKLWTLRYHYGSPLAVDPFLLPEIVKIQNQARRISTWGHLPIEHAVPLLRDALSWLDEAGPHVLTVLFELDRARGSLRGMSKASMRRTAINAYRSIATGSNSYKWLEVKLNAGEMDPQELFREALHLSLGAAIIVILLFTGVRCSELLSLQLDCVVRKRHMSGNEYWYIEGIAAKKGGRTRNWVVSEPVVDVIKFLERVHTITCGDVPDMYLFSIPNGNGILPPPYVSIRRLWPSTTADLLRKFAQSAARSNPLPDAYRLHPHQARKTFAKLVVLRNRRGLERFSN